MFVTHCDTSVGNLRKYVYSNKNYYCTSLVTSQISVSNLAHNFNAYMSTVKCNYSSLILGAIFM